MLEESSTASTVKEPGWGIVSGTLWAFAAFMGPQFLVTFLVPFVRSLAVGSDTKLFILEALTEIVIFLVILIVIKLYGSSLADIGLKRFPSLKNIGFVFVFMLLYMLTSEAVIALVGLLFPQLNLLTKQQIGFRASGVGEMILVFIALVVIPPVVEETVFRGFLFKAYRYRLGFIWAAISVSLLFAIAHTPIAVSIDVFILSLYLCYLREKTDNLWSSIMLHALKNLVAFAYLFIITTR